MNDEGGTEVLYIYQITIDSLPTPHGDEGVDKIMIGYRLSSWSSWNSVKMGFMSLMTWHRPRVYRVILMART